MPDILFHSEHVTVIGQDAGSRTVVATFNEMGSSVDGTKFWGQGLLERAGVSAIGFVSARPNWYPPADMEPAIAAAQKWVEGRRIVTYGFSQGGYGALKFGAKLGASLAVAFSPQWSIDPKDVGRFDSRFTQFHNPELKNGDRIIQADLCPQNYIVTDTDVPMDAGHARHLLELQRIRLVPASFCGHDSVRLISEARTGGDLVQLFLREAGLPGHELRALLRASRAGSATYRYEKVASLQRSSKRHPRLLAAAVAGLASGSAQDMARVISAVLEGDLGGAANLMVSIPDEALRELGPHRYWADFRRTGFDYGESRIAPLYKQCYETAVNVRLHGVNSMLRLKQTATALEELREIAALPGAKAEAHHFVDFYRQAGRPDLAAVHTEILCKDESRPRTARVRLVLDQIGATRASGDRPLLFKQLRTLDEIARLDDENVLLQLADAYLEIGEFAFAASAAARIPRDSPRHAIATMYPLHVLDRTDRAAAGIAVRKFMSGSSDDFHYWLKLSKVAGNITGLDEALVAAQRAMKTPNVEPIIGGLRVVEVLTAAGRTRPAINELRKVLTLGPRIADYGHGLAEWATRLEEPGLAADFSAVWLAKHPADAHPNIVHLHYLSRAKPASDVVPPIDALLRKIDDGLTLTRDQFSFLLDISSGVDRALGGRCAALALKRFPADGQFQAATTPNSFEAKFGLGLGDPHRPRGAARRRGLISRLFGAG
jgi:hypothetical protein